MKKVECALLQPEPAVGRACVRRAMTEERTDLRRSENKTEGG